jgi:hypothetical protein
MRLLVPALCLAAALGLNAQPAPVPHRIQVLIITGQDKHPWRETTPYLREVLNRTAKFEVRITEEFHGATAETLAPYDVAVLNYSDEKLDVPKWGPATRTALLSFVRSGKGLVVCHHSAASFQDWDEFEKLAGCVWRTAQSHHSPVHDYRVDIRDPDHPITHGMLPFYGADRRVVRRPESAGPRPTITCWPLAGTTTRFTPQSRAIPCQPAPHRMSR